MNQPVSSPAASAGSPSKCVEVAIAVVFEAALSGAEGEKLLICKRKADAVLGGYWEFPGGKCHVPESPADCAVREVEEETGLQVRILAPLPVIEHTYPHARVRLHPFVCTPIGGRLELRAVAEARWISPASVGAFRFPEANGSLLEQVRQGQKALLDPPANPAPS